ncbi:uncharacterized protein LOC112127881 [Cimex lectularius]|uniref:CCHC-type domain-containing protein n=1 Tax=Cimex lectularius TaxID=79782 RepID=A0A8I6SQ57_CIMLE|nr:uncharacterized protein LOC112127881 [Cimex lectularius]
MVMETKHLGATPVKTSPHRKLNSSQGVISARDLLTCSEEEIKEELSSQGVIEVKRIKRKTDRGLINTASLILTFDRPEMPKEVWAIYQRFLVRPFLPAPMRCFKCLKFGHTALRCRNQNTICSCGVPVHEGRPCVDPPRCVNCDGPHHARSSACRILKEEREIQRLKAEKGMSHVEARALVRSSAFSRPNMSYARAAGQSAPKKGLTVEMAIQTEPSPPIYTFRGCQCREDRFLLFGRKDEGSSLL